MPRKRSHNERTPREREVYARDIRDRDASPTVEQALPFTDKVETEPDRAQPSDQPGVNLSKPSVKRARKISWTTRAANHITANLIGYLIAVFIVIGGCKRRLKSAAGGARKVRHLPSRRERFLGFEVKSGKFAAR